MSDPAKACFNPNSTSDFGLGIRLSCYFIAVLGAVTPIKSTFLQGHFREIEQGNQDVQPTREISNVVTIQGVTGLGLLATAVIQTSQNQLNLYHAYLIINLLFLLSTSFLYFLFSPNPVVRRRSFYLLSLIFLAIFSLYVGLNARTFGSQPECNNTVKIIWFPRQITASFAWFRGFGIAIFAIYISVAVTHGVQLKFFRKRASGSASGNTFRSHGLAVLVINLVLMGVIEATIDINNVADTNSLSSFGQTLPLVMLIVPITDVWNDNYPLLKAKLLKSRVAHTHGSPDHIPLASRVSLSSHGSRPSRSKYYSVDSYIST